MTGLSGALTSTSASDPKAVDTKLEDTELTRCAGLTFESLKQMLQEQHVNNRASINSHDRGGKFSSFPRVLAQQL